MKMILNSIGKSSGVDVTIGEIYEHVGEGFLDDNGIRRIVSHFGWMALSDYLQEGKELNFADYMSENAETQEIKDDDRVEFVPDTSLSRKEIVAESKAFGVQVDGKHYTDMELQPLEATYLRYGLVGLKAAIHTKVDKYISRKKDNEVVQLKKAHHCLGMLVEITELENENNS